MQLQSNYTFCAQAITPHITFRVRLIKCFHFYLNNNNLITFYKHQVFKCFVGQRALIWPEYFTPNTEDSFHLN